MKKILFGLFLVLNTSGIPIKGYSQIIINEIMPSNGDATWDFTTVNKPSWIELHNTGKTNFDLAGFHLSDDPSLIRKWSFPQQTIIPAKGFLLVWCDEKNASLYTGFGLSARGEELILSAPDGSVMDHLIYPQQYLNVSYGRTTDGSTAWSYFTEATPGESNKGTYSNQVAGKVTFSIPPGAVSQGQQVSLSTGMSGGFIRFTTDGSEPTATSPVFSNPITITGTTTIKARVYAEKFIPGATATQTFFVHDHDIKLPIVSLSLMPRYLWDDFTGIYVEGTNGIPGNCSESRNWNQDWERHAVMEYFNEQGIREEVADVDIRVGGACSRNYPQKSLVVKARSKYGADQLSVGVFPNRTIKEVGGFILRNSGNDFNVTHFRDAFAQSLAASQLDVDYLDYQPVVVYLNGTYWGIMNIREKADTDYFRDNAGLEPEEMDLIEVTPAYFSGKALAGSMQGWEQYLGGLQAMDRTRPEAFTFIDNNIDVDSYINYAVTEIYLGNTDWPGNNVRFWRSNKGDGKFRWVLWDLDFSFALFQDFSSATHPTLHFATDASQGWWPNPAVSTLHLRLLMDNPTFRQRFAGRFFAAMEETFHPERVDVLLKKFSDQIESEMFSHKIRWGGRMEDWHWELERIRKFANDRYIFMKVYAREFFNIQNTINLEVSSPNPVHGFFSIDEVNCNRGIFRGNVPEGAPITLKPVPEPGYQFSSWEIVSQKSETASLLNDKTVWKFLDTGEVESPDWFTSGYNDQNWKSGIGEFGYGDGDETTLVSFGSNAGNKHITTWFRTNFSVTDTTGIKSLLGTLKYDDGVVLYLNGAEVYRANMPEGVITALTTATGVAQEEFIHAIELPVRYLNNGQNIIAAEVHQVSPGSSDISFKLDLEGIWTGEIETQISMEEVLRLEGLVSARVSVLFKEDERKFTGLVINEIAANNNSSTEPIREDWIELYNSGSETLDLNGLLISDDPKNPRKYALRTDYPKLQLAPGQFLVLIADSRNMAGPLHLPFRLSSKGEALGIFSASGLTIETVDNLNYDEQASEASWARIPDGTGPLVQTSTVTPGATNIFALGGIDSESVKFNVYPNPFLNYFQFSEKPEEFEIFNPLGQRIDFQIEESGKINFPGIPSGIYVIKYRLQGKTSAIRILKQ